jgi:hypothetical protein
MCHAVSLFRVDYIPFAADHRSGCTLGRRVQRPVGRHARMVELPSGALLRELGQASLTVTLVGSLVASRGASQAPACYAGVLDSPLKTSACSILKHLYFNSFCSSCQKLENQELTLRRAQFEADQPGADEVLESSSWYR